MTYQAKTVSSLKLEFCSKFDLPSKNVFRVKNENFTQILTWLVTENKRVSSWNFCGSKMKNMHEFWQTQQKESSQVKASFLFEFWLTKLKKKEICISSKFNILLPNFPLTSKKRLEKECLELGKKCSGSRKKKYFGSKLVKLSEFRFAKQKTKSCLNSELVRTKKKVCGQNSWFWQAKKKKVSNQYFT